MDITALELSDLAHAFIEGKAVSIGRQGDAEVTADGFADSLGTIN